MKRVALSVSLAAFLCAAIAASDSTKAAKREIAARYAAISKAFVQKDFKSFGAFMADDFQATVMGGKPVGRDGVIADFSQMRDLLNEVKWAKKIKRLTLDGATAHVWAEGKLTAKMAGSDNKPHSFALNAASEDDWIKTGDMWLLKSTKTTKFDAMIDGKPMTGH